MHSNASRKVHPIMQKNVIWPAAKTAFDRTSSVFGWAFFIFLIQSLFVPTTMKAIQESALLLSALFISLCIADFYRAYQKTQKKNNANHSK